MLFINVFAFNNISFELSVKYRSQWIHHHYYHHQDQSIRSDSIRSFVRLVDPSNLQSFNGDCSSKQIWGSQPVGPPGSTRIQWGPREPTNLIIRTFTLSVHNFAIFLSSSGNRRVLQHNSTRCTQRNTSQRGLALCFLPQSRVSQNLWQIRNISAQCFRRTQKWIWIIRPSLCLINF